MRETQVRVFVQTRGTARAADYAFLGAAPPEPWWRAYRDVTAFDHPTVLVTSDGRGWAAYLSGIPSLRTDAVGTVVRYTLALDGPCAAAEAGRVVAAVGAWLADVAAGHGDRPGGRLTAALDARFPAADVEGWLGGGTAGPHSPPVLPDERHGRRTGSDESAVRQEGPGSAGGRIGDEVRRRALAALGALPVPVSGAAVPAVDGAGVDRSGVGGPGVDGPGVDGPGVDGSGVDGPGDWIGAVGAPGPRGAFTARVAALVGGRPGRALLLNLVGGPDEVRPLLDPGSPVVVLVESTDPELARCTALRPVVEAKKAPARPAPVGVAALTGIALVPVVALLAVTALLVTLVVLLL